MNEHLKLFLKEWRGRRLEPEHNSEANRKPGATGYLSIRFDVDYHIADDHKADDRRRWVTPPVVRLR